MSWSKNIERKIAYLGQ